MGRAMSPADQTRILDAEAKRVRKGWERAENHRRTWANYHPAQLRSDLRSKR